MHFAKKMSEFMPKEGLKLAIHRELANWDKPHDIERLHASDLTNEDTKFCPREFALLELLDVKRKGRFICTALQYTFDLGRAMEYKLQNKWAAHIAVGDWKCNHCEHIVYFSRKPKGNCPKCSGMFEYQEMRFMSEYSGASGGVDLLVKLPSEKLLRLVEAKSIDKDYFIKLQAPMSEHRSRTNLYMRLVAESDSPYKDYINQKEALTFYMVKAYGKMDAEIKDSGISDSPFSPFKEYFVKRDDKQTQKASDLARGLHLFRKGEAGMPAGTCENAMCKRAKYCLVKKQCFGKQLPAGISKEFAIKMVGGEL